VVTLQRCWIVIVGAIDHLAFQFGKRPIFQLLVLVQVQVRDFGLDLELGRYSGFMPRLEIWSSVEIADEESDERCRRANRTLDNGAQRITVTR